MSATVTRFAGLTVLPRRLDVMERMVEVGDLITALDADNECRHGRLPHDSTPECGCWGPIATAPLTTGQED